MITAARDSGLGRADGIKLSITAAKAAPCGAQAASLGVQPEYSDARLFVPRRVDGDRGNWFVDVDAVQPTRRSFDANRLAVYGLGPVSFELRDRALSSDGRSNFGNSALQESSTTVTQAKPVEGQRDTFVSQAWNFKFPVRNCVGLSILPRMKRIDFILVVCRELFSISLLLLLLLLLLIQFLLIRFFFVVNGRQILTDRRGVEIAFLFNMVENIFFVGRCKFQFQFYFILYYTK